MQEELGAILPGARWTVWLPRHMGDETLGLRAVAAIKIREILEGHEGDQITIRALKAKDPDFFDALPRSTFQRARDEAIKASSWTVRAGSLVRAGTGAGVEVETMRLAA
jgi:hypothetical protein